jgi:tetratricopeptide (TPR) repeat protein
MRKARDARLACGKAGRTKEVPPYYNPNLQTSRMVALRILTILVSTVVVASPISLTFPQNSGPKTTPGLDAVPGRVDTDVLDAPSERFDARNCPQTTVTLAQALARNPKDAHANLMLAQCSLELSDYAKAVAYASRAVELEPASSEAHLLLGRSYGLEAEREHSLLVAKKVRREFELAVQLDGDNLPARRDLMEFYLEAPWILGGSQAKAWQQVEAIAGHDLVAGHLARAEFWQHGRQFQRAEFEYRTTLELKPERVEPYFAIAEFYEKRGDAGGIETAIKPASSIRPDDPRLEYYRGVVGVLGAGRLADAERLLKSYLAGAPIRSDFPSRAAADEWLGRLCERSGRTQQAVEYYKTALQLDAHRRNAREALARLHVGG